MGPCANQCRPHWFDFGWIDVFNDEERDELVVLQDDEGDTYPALMGQQLSVNKLAKVVSVNLEFEEVKPSR